MRMPSVPRALWKWLGVVDDMLGRYYAALLLVGGAVVVVGVVVRVYGAVGTVLIVVGIVSIRIRVVSAELVTTTS